MAILNQILVWSKNDLKPWQQDAVRRLFQQTLNTDALDDLYAMLRSSVGLPDTKNRKPQPLGAEHLPVNADRADAAILLSMSDIKHVNRLAANQTLAFAPSGLTVIYGGNGAGKSGYTRVLKKACRSRDQLEDVRPNAYSKPNPLDIPTATFQIKINGKSQTLNWKKGVSPPKELATIAVFDTHCARAYLDQQQEIAYLPFGLDVVENLAQFVIPKLLEKLNAEITATLTTTDSFQHLLGSTAVGTLISGLSEKTDVAVVEALATVSQEEKRRSEELVKTLNENDPKTKAKEFKLAAARINVLKAKIEANTAWVKNEAIQKLQAMDVETEVALAAEISAATALRSGEELLPGTGDVQWKSLFQAAKEFSLSAYQSKEFPHVHEGSKCLLCQQKITEDAGARLQRFEAYIQANVAKVASEKRTLRSAAIIKIENASLAIDLDHALAEELLHLDEKVVAEIKAFSTVIELRKAWMLNAQKSHDWNGIVDFPIDPCIRLHSIIEKLTNQEQIYEKATDDKQRAILTAELAEINARINLSPHKQAVLDVIDRKKIKALLMKCRDDLKTKNISDKAKEFASSAVTEPLRAALKEEFEALGVTSIMPKLNESVERGKMRHKLELQVQTQAQIKDILSEGEQRAIAIGSFLAELRTGGHGGGIVFDDPVSSLDHTRRQYVASRLVEEAKIRQVIVFTHDSTFLGELSDRLEQHNVANLVHYLEWEGSSSGKVVAGLPWQHKSYKDRIDKLQQAQVKLASTWPDYPSEDQSAAMRSQYSAFRATIERVIQDVIFNGVVIRYRDWIKVGNLSAVVGFDEGECKEIERLHKICCDTVDAHDPSSGKNASVPTAEQYGNDIAALVSLTDAIKRRREKKVQTL